MEDLHISLFAFLGVLEFSLLLIVVAAVFVIRGKGLARRIAALQGKLKEKQEKPDPVSYAQYLRDEVLRNQGLIERAAAAEDDAEKNAGRLLEMRKCFLELELEAHSLEKNPVAFQDRIAAGISELIEQLRPEQETVKEIESVTEETETTAEPEQEADEEESEQRKVHDTHEEELDHLKQVIYNQQDAMSVLREKLKEHEDELEDLGDVLKQLDEYEKGSKELHTCLEELEKENQRLKADKENPEGGGVKIQAMDPAQLTGLKSMVGDQQKTIGHLQDLIRELAPDAGKAKELEDAIEAIKRTNQELNGCVTVLEDENTKLRSELEQIVMQLEAKTAEAEEQAEPVIEPPADEAGDEEDAGDSPQEDEMKQMEIKVQELEALVEFKDAAIEELEKQYNSLEAKYLAATDSDSV